MLNLMPTGGIGNKGLAMLEYAVLASVFVLALMVMPVYLSRAIKGRVKADTDQIGEQYSPKYSNYNYHKYYYNTNVKETDESGQTTTELLEDEFNANSPYIDDFSKKQIVGSNAEGLDE